MPPGAVERDGQVEGGGGRSHSFAPNPSNEIGIIEIIESSSALFPGNRVDHGPRAATATGSRACRRESPRDRSE
jgi:hypothetical protein